VKIETSMTSQVGKNHRPYFPCVHHRLVSGKHPQRHWHNSQLNSCTHNLLHTGHRHGFRFFLNFFDICTGDTLLQKTVNIHDTGSKSGSYHHKKPYITVSYPHRFTFEKFPPPKWHFRPFEMCQLVANIFQK